MAEFDDKLNSILSNPDAMAQIMQLAQSLSGGTGGNNAANAPPPPPSQPGGSSPGWGQQPQTPPPSGGDPLSALAGGLDPQLLLRFLPLIQELGGARDSNARQLLYALRPYLKPERQEKVERALQLARLFHLGRKFLAGWGGETCITATSATTRAPTPVSRRRSPGIHRAAPPLPVSRNTRHPAAGSSLPIGTAPPPAPP